MRFSSSLMYFLGLTLLSSNQVIASTKEETTTSLHKIIAIAGGYDFISSARPQTLELLPPFVNYYTVDNADGSFGMGGLFGGIEYWKNPQWGIQLGAAVYSSSNTSINGTIWQFGLPEFANLNYSYQLETTRLLVESKLLTTLDMNKKLHPYLSGGLGLALNKLSNYQETPLIPEVLPMLPFADRQQTSFTWGLGFGLDMDINSYLRLGLGYQYFNLGKFSLGSSPEAATQQSLSINSLNGNELRAQLSFVI